MGQLQSPGQRNKRALQAGGTMKKRPRDRKCWQMEAGATWHHVEGPSLSLLALEPAHLPRAWAGRGSEAWAGQGLP